MVDGSGSIEYYGKGNFRRCLNFVKTMISRFHVSRYQTRVGIVVYSSRPRIVLQFYQTSNRGQVNNVINRIRYPRGGTRTGLALGYASRLFRYSKGRKKVVIVMTDGYSGDSVVRPALSLKRQGVEIFSLGIGRKYNSKQLRQMASTTRHVYTAGFRNLNSVVRAIKQKACRRGKREPRWLL